MWLLKICFFGGLAPCFLNLSLFKFRLELLKEALKGFNVGYIFEVFRVLCLLFTDEASNHEVKFAWQIFVSLDYKLRIFLQVHQEPVDLILRKIVQACLVQDPVAVCLHEIFVA
jgi:hypothetical protein